MIFDKEKLYPTEQSTLWKTILQSAYLDKIALNIPDIIINSNCVSCLQCKYLCPAPITVDMNKTLTVGVVQVVRCQSSRTCSHNNKCLQLIMFE